MLGEEVAAVKTLAEALTPGVPTGLCPGLRRRGRAYGRAAGPADRGQRAGQAAAKVPLGCLARLQRAFQAPHATPGPRPGAAAAVPGLTEALTARELEVLGMLASGRSNQAIARASLS